jgi:Cdc6-like AAA superfamily ATPase
MSRSGKRVKPALLETFARLVLGELPWPLFLHGEVGTGKTRAALYFCDCVVTARYYTAEDIADAIMDGGMPDMVRYSLVVLDELAERTKSSDLGYQAVKRVLDQRERHNHNVAVIVSNFAPDDLEEAYDGRIVSRLKAGTVFELKAKDRRQE